MPNGGPFPPRLLITLLLTLTALSPPAAAAPFNYTLPTNSSFRRDSTVLVSPHPTQYSRWGRRHVFADRDTIIVTGPGYSGTDGLVGFFSVAPEHPDWAETPFTLYGPDGTGDDLGTSLAAAVTVSGGSQLILGGDDALGPLLQPETGMFTAWPLADARSWRSASGTGATIYEPPSGTSRNFANEIAADGDWVFVGEDPDPAFTDAHGFVFPFRLEGGVWIHKGQVLSSDVAYALGTADYFGQRIWLALPYAGIAAKHGVAVYKLEDDVTWSQIASLNSCCGGVRATAHVNGWAAVGDKDADWQGVENVGSVTLFHRDMGGPDAFGQVGVFYPPTLDGILEPPLFTRAASFGRALAMAVVDAAQAGHQDAEEGTAAWVRIVVTQQSSTTVDSREPIVFVFDFPDAVRQSPVPLTNDDLVLVHLLAPPPNTDTSTQWGREISLSTDGLRLITSDHDRDAGYAEYWDLERPLERWRLWPWMVGGVVLVAGAAAVFFVVQKRAAAQDDAEAHKTTSDYDMTSMATGGSMATGESVVRRIDLNHTSTMNLFGDQGGQQAPPRTPMTSWGSSDVLTWLHSIELGRYAADLEDASGPSLLTLTEADLTTTLGWPLAAARTLLASREAYTKSKKKKKNAPAPE